MRVAVLIILLITLSCGGSSDNQTGPISDSAMTIEAFRQQYVNKIYTVEVEEIIAGISQDVVYLDHNMEHDEDLDPFIEPITSRTTPKMQVIPEGMEITDSITIEWGLVQVEVPDEADIWTQNKYLFFYERQSKGDWLITKVIYNQI